MANARCSKCKARKPCDLSPKRRRKLNPIMLNAIKHKRIRFGTLDLAGRFAPWGAAGPLG